MGVIPVAKRERYLFLFLSASSAFFALYVLFSLNCPRQFASLLKQNGGNKLASCSVDICYSESPDITVSLPLDSIVFSDLNTLLHSNWYKKTIGAVLGQRVQTFHVEVDPVYRIFLYYSDNSRIEIIVNGSSILVGSPSESGSLAYFVVEESSLYDGLNALLQQNLHLYSAPSNTIC